MSKFTLDAPFMAPSGFNVIRDGAGRINAEGLVLRPDRAGSIAEFIEAERDEWAYTNDEHTEARKGRWTVAASPRSVAGGRGWTVGHADFPNGVLLGSHQEVGALTPQVQAKIILDDFLAWRAAQNQPAEPTGLGAVVEDAAGDTWTRAHRCVLPWCKTPRHDNGGATVWGRWADIIGPVTILSSGVDA